MSQHDYVIANQSGAAFRADLNNALAAIVSQNSGAAEPSTTYAYQFWADITAGVLKQRNAANNAWITLFQLDGEWSTIALEDGTAAAPSLYFKDSGTDTGVYSPGADQVGIATGGVQRVNFNGSTEVVFNDGGEDIDFRIEGDTDSSLFFVDAGNDSVSIGGSGKLLVGTSGTSENCRLVVSGRLASGTDQGVVFIQRGSSGPGAVADGSGIGEIIFSDSDGNQAARIDCLADATWGAGGSDYPGRIEFSTTADGASSPTERMRIGSDGTLVKYGDTNSARILPQTDNAGFIGQTNKRWEALYAVNGTIQTSDEREKTEIQTSQLGADFIRALRPVSYKWKIGGYTSTWDDEGNETITPNPGVRTHYGFIAQEVKQACGNTDFGGWLQEDLNDPESMQSLRLHEFISPIVKALQEALDEIDTLKAEVAALKGA